MADDSRETVMGVKPAQGGTGWFTGIALGTNTGLAALSFPNISLDGTRFDNPVFGNAELEDSPKIEENVSVTIPMHLKRQGEAQIFLASYMGDDTVVTTGDPEVHDLNWQPNTTGFVTVGIEIASTEIMEFASLKVNAIEIKYGDDGFLQFSATCLGDTIQIDTDATNTGTEFDAITFMTKTLKIPNNQCEFRMNSQSGGSLGSGDVIKLSDFVFNSSRPGLDVPERVSQGVSSGPEYQSDEPVQTGTAISTLSITEADFPAIGLLDDFKDSVEYKANLIATATVATKVYTFTLELGRLLSMPQEIPLNLESRFPTVRNFKLLKPSSTPTGLTNANPFHIENKDQITTDYFTF